MSKIYKVRKAFQKIFSHLKNHEVSCIFFNNDVKILSTMVGYEHQVEHSLLYQTIQNIKCSSITNFAKIIEGLKEIDDIHTDLEQISVVISDGHHTVDDETNISLSTITSILEKRFDHAIGLGNEYDRDLLQKIGKNFHETQTENMFNFLNCEFFDHSENFLIVPPDSFFVTSSEYKKVVVDEWVTERTENISCIEKGIIQNTYKLKSVEQLPVETRKHYIFVIDISGSMDDCFLSRVVESYYHDANYFYEKTSLTEPTCIRFYDENPIVSIMKSSQDMYMPAQNDEIIETCFLLFNTEKSIEHDLEKLFVLSNTTFQNKKFQRFVKKKYNQLLSPGQQYLLNLLHEPITQLSKQYKEPYIYEEVEIETCPICLNRHRNIVFSCLHLVSCIECVQQLLTNNKHECPVCREPIKWLRECKFVTESMRCMECEDNCVNVLHLPCNHAYLCNRCFEKKEKPMCSKCEIPMDSFLHMKII